MTAVSASNRATSRRSTGVHAIAKGVGGVERLRREITALEDQHRGDDSAGIAIYVESDVGRQQVAKMMMFRSI